MTLFPAQTIEGLTELTEGVKGLTMDQTSPDEGAFNLSRERVGSSEIGSPTSQQERDSEGSFDRVSGCGRSGATIKTRQACTGTVQCSLAHLQSVTKGDFRGRKRKRQESSSRHSCEKLRLVAGVLEKFPPSGRYGTVRYGAARLHYHYAACLYTTVCRRTYDVTAPQLER